jgi:hypothetical protein
MALSSTKPLTEMSTRVRSDNNFAKCLKILGPSGSHRDLSVSRDSSVGIATRYGLDGPVIECKGGGGEIFRLRPDRLCGLRWVLSFFSTGKADGKWC